MNNFLSLFVDDPAGPLCERVMIAVPCDKKMERCEQKGNMVECVPKPTGLPPTEKPTDKPTTPTPPRTTYSPTVQPGTSFCFN